MLTRSSETASTKDSARRTSSCDADNLCDLEGYTVLVCPHVNGEFEGADFDKPVALDNGMIFTFHGDNYSYAHLPPTVVFARVVTAHGRRLVLYKLLIGDAPYEAVRVK